MYYLGAIMSRRSVAYLLHVVTCSLNSQKALKSSHMNRQLRNEDFRKSKLRIFSSAMCFVTPTRGCVIARSSKWLGTKPLSYPVLTATLKSCGIRGKIIPS